MATGLGIALLTLGAIIAFVLHADIPGLGDTGLGWILMIAGLLSIGLSLAKTHQRTRRHTTVRRDQDATTGSFVEERHTA